MNKAELVNWLAEDCRISKRQADILVATLTRRISDALIQGERISISGLGIFSSYRRSSRNGVHPQNGSAIRIKAKMVPRLKSGRRLICRLNETE